MPTYITLGRYTQQGISNIKESPNRLDAVKAAASSAGAQIKDFYLTMGEYDLVLITEAPDDQTVARLLLGIGSQGNVSTETLRAFTEDEFRQLVGSLP